MRKSLKVFVASLMVLGLLFVTFGSVFALPAPTTALAEPVAVESFAGEKFTAVVVTPPNLPGTMDEGGMIMPVGMGSGEGQFSGNGLKVSGLKDGETVSVKFDFKYYNHMWKGSIYKWDGTRWVKLATTVVPPAADESITWATASGVGNGKYVLIIGNYGVPKIEYIV